MNRWLPGSIPLFTDEFFKEPGDLPLGDVAEMTDIIHLPADMPPGTYALSIGVVDDVPSKPVVQLAIKGRADDGWYPLSKIEVVK